MDDSTPTTPQAETPRAETPLARTPINASESNLKEATAYVKALAAVEKLKLDSPSKACEASPCIAGGSAQAPRSSRTCWKSFPQISSSGELLALRPSKRKWSDGTEDSSPDGSPAPPSSSKRDIKSRN